MEPDITPLMAQYDSIKNNYKNCVLFFRLGDFYEMFGEDATEVSRLLNLTLTHRSNRPMCGVPFHASKVYIARLLRLGKKIAICEQVGEVPKGKGITERAVVEIITPGTVLESEYIEGSNNNYLACLAFYNGRASFSCIDISTSYFTATSWKASNVSQKFAKELERCSPRELLLPQSLKTNDDIQRALSLYPNIALSYYPDWNFSFDNSFKNLTSLFGTVNLQSFGLNENSSEVVSAGFLIDYLTKTTSQVLSHVKTIHIFKDSEFLQIDESTFRNLEVFHNLHDGSEHYSLFECVNFTKTAMGQRLLRRRLAFPLTSVSKIKERQENISLFVQNKKLLSDVRSVLSSILDVERLASRIALGKAHPKDLQALRLSLIHYLKLCSLLSSCDFSFSKTEEAEKIISFIQNSIKDDPPTVITEGGIIVEGFSSELDNWRKIHDDFGKVLQEYEAEEKEKTGIQNLKIKYTNAFGYFIEISKGKLNSVPPHFIMRRALVNGDRYTTEKLKELETQLIESSTKILELERDLFIQIRNEIAQYVSYLQNVSLNIAHIDTSASFAEVAILYNWTCPVVDESLSLYLEEARHPIVEKNLPTGEFIPNDVCLDENNKNFSLLTGPNMAGKSTYLRQAALIVLLAQTGSYIPARNARLGLCDQIFCRVGASDNLARGESTFLVEMTETAHILRNATKKSLVIMDEVGRGTSTEDGLSLAWAISEYLLNHIQCKTLFATHYHELTQIEHPLLQLLCMSVLEERGTVVFLRKVKEGKAESSYGIHVASLAGVPEEVTSRASAILAHLKNEKQEHPLLTSTPDKKESFISPGLFSDEEIILDEILSQDPDAITPLQALALIARWKKTLQGK